jgi:nucleotide-binding universal stress UspA family protein
MFKHIGVGLDGSTYSSTAEGVAVELAGRLEGTAHGIHIIDASFIEGAFITDISGAMGFEPFLNLQTQMRDTLEEFARTIQSRFEERCREVGVPGCTHVKRSGVVHGMLEATKLVDLLVVGQRGANAKFHEDLLGPNTEALLRRSPVPLLVVPEQFSGLPCRPAVAYDGSVKAARALHFAAELAGQLGLPLNVITVDDNEEHARRLLAEAAEYLAPHDVHPELVHLAGTKVEEVLLSKLGGEGFDLLCLGAHGHRRIIEMVTGSTTDYLARRSPVPVLCATQP